MCIKPYWCCLVLVYWGISINFTKATRETFIFPWFPAAKGSSAWHTVWSAFCHGSKDTSLSVIFPPHWKSEYSAEPWVNPYIQDDLCWTFQAVNVTGQKHCVPYLCTIIYIYIYMCVCVDIVTGGTYTTTWLLIVIGWHWSHLLTRTVGIAPPFLVRSVPHGVSMN